MRGSLKIAVTPERKETSGSSKRGLENNVKIDLKETGWVCELD
jgi:hypothetical protein